MTYGMEILRVEGTRAWKPGDPYEPMRKRENHGGARQEEIDICLRCETMGCRNGTCRKVESAGRRKRA